jgi:hypothetical protein
MLAATFTNGRHTVAEKELTARQQAYLDSLADDADDDGEPEEVEWQGKRYRLVEEEDTGPKVVKRKAKVAAPPPAGEPAPKRRRFVT